MSRKANLLAKIRNNPKAVPFDDLDKILKWYGFERRRPRSGSSHTIYTYGTHIITVPYKRPYVKQPYVDEVLKILDEIDAI
jgi:hypothetical protein